MGLDMYLTGRKQYVGYGAPLPKDEEGHDIDEVIVKLGYWRKHANLHGYIVQKFGPKNEETGEAIDDCRDIELTLEDLEHLLQVVVKPADMPKTEGFFFGESDNSPEQIEEDTEIITKAIGFLAAKNIVPNDSQNVWRSVIYRASW